MKTFKQFVTNTGVIPVPIHFKHVPMVDITKGVIPVPIHFKYIPQLDQKDNLQESDEPESTNPEINGWIMHNDNKEFHGDLNNYELARKLRAGNLYHHIDPEHRQAIYNYTGSLKTDDRSAYTMNRMLIKRDPDVNPSHRLISDGIRNHSLKVPLHVYSGVGFDPDKVKDETGRIHSPAFISATHDKGLAVGFADHSMMLSDTRHILHIHLKPGDRAMHIAHISHYDHEHETIIDKNTTLQKTHHEDLSKKHYPNLHYRVHHVHIVEEPK